VSAAVSKLAREYRAAPQRGPVVELEPTTLQPGALALVGMRVFVVGKTEDGNHIAALVELADKGKLKAGAAVYKLGPATDITVITRDGKPRVALHKATTTKSGMRHDIELIAGETGKRIGAAKSVELDNTENSAKLGFRINHWSDGMTRAYGIKAGEWDRKENERAPDVEAAYDVLSGKFSDKKKIEDLFEQRRRFQALADSGRRLDFIRMAWDNASIQLWKGGKVRAVELDQPIMTYDPKSLQGVVAADGTGWFVLKVDPVNAEAVARKKADPEYLDIFRVGADGKAVRKGRVYAQGTRHRFGIVGDKVWLLERLTGFERGARSLALYSVP